MKHARVLAGMALVLTLAVAAWAGEKIKMTASSADPSAVGEVQTGHDQNGNMEVVVRAEYLAPPDRLTPPEHVYVVWLQPPHAQAQNLGEMKVGQHEVGEFRTTTNEKAFDVFITAEDHADVSVPTGPEVLRASVGR